MIFHHLQFVLGAVDPRPPRLALAEIGQWIGIGLFQRQAILAGTAPQRIIIAQLEQFALRAAGFTMQPVPLKFSDECLFMPDRTQVARAVVEPA